MVFLTTKENTRKITSEEARNSSSNNWYKKVIWCIYNYKSIYFTYLFGGMVCSVLHLHNIIDYRINNGNINYNINYNWLLISAYEKTHWVAIYLKYGANT